MIRDLVVYFLKQGPYTGKGDIAVLCAYLGQLQKVRAALKDARLAVTLDERDREQLAQQAEGEEVAEEQESFENVQIAKHVSCEALFSNFADDCLDTTGDCRHIPRRGG